MQHVIFLFLAVVLLPQEARAQTLPPTVAPGVIERQFELPVEPKSSEQQILPPIGSPDHPDQAEEIRFNLSDLIVSGSTVYAEADLRPLYQRFLGKEINLAIIFAVADEITKKYANDGFALCLAFVPAQEIENGVAQLQIVEGYIDAVEFIGTVASSRNLIQEHAN